MKRAMSVIWLLWIGTAAAATPFVLSDGTSRVAPVILHCKSSGNITVPCGNAANPLVVSSGSGGATSANQQAQVTAEQSSAQALGAPADAAYAGGTGSVTSLLKSLWSIMGNGISAIPIGGVPTSRSISLSGMQSTVLFTANPARHYLSFQVPQGSYIWINLVGGTAAPNAIDCAYFAPGTFYESGQYVNRGSITIFSPVSVVVSAWEG